MGHLDPRFGELCLWGRGLAYSIARLLDHISSPWTHKNYGLSLTVVELFGWLQNVFARSYDLDTMPNIALEAITLRRSAKIVRDRPYVSIKS